MPFDGTFAHLVNIRPKGVVLSPSQVDKYVRCHRAWAFEYLGGLRPPPKPSAELGTLVHSILEAWLTYGTPPDTRTKAGKIAFKMIAMLPLPGTGVTERQAYIVTRNGFSYTFKIDWSGIFWNWPTIIDHKTTGDLKYAKTEAGLHCDVQSITYTIAGCLGFEVDDIQLLWNYGTTKDRDPVIVPIRTRMNLAVAIEKFERVIEPIAAEIVAARSSRINPRDFPPNPDACGDFGGCPHQGICNLTQEERMRALMSDQNQPTLAARLSTMPQATNGYAPPVVYSNGFVPPAAPQYPPPAAPQYAPPPGQQYAPPPGPQFAPPPQNGFMPPGAPPQQPQQAQQPQQTFTPPASAPMQQLPMNYPPAGSPPNAPESGAQLPQVGFQPPNPPQSTSAAPQAPQNGAQEPAPAKRGRGRPRKTEGAEEQQTATHNAFLQEVYVAGFSSFMKNPQWNGQLDQLIWAGDMAVQAYNARFG